MKLYKMSYNSNFRIQWTCLEHGMLYIPNSAKPGGLEWAYWNSRVQDSWSYLKGETTPDLQTTYQLFGSIQWTAIQFHSVNSNSVPFSEQQFSFILLHSIQFRGSIFVVSAGVGIHTITTLSALGIYKHLKQCHCILSYWGSVLKIHYIYTTKCKAVIGW